MKLNSDTHFTIAGLRIAGGAYAVYARYLERRIAAGYKTALRFEEWSRNPKAAENSV